MEDDADVRHVTLLPVRAEGAGQDAVDLADQLVRAMFGATAVAAEVVLRSLGDSLPNARGPAWIVRTIPGMPWGWSSALRGRLRR